MLFFLFLFVVINSNINIDNFDDFRKEDNLQYDSEIIVIHNRYMLEVQTLYKI